MDGIAQLPAFLLAATLVILVPGPACLYVAGLARHSSRSAGLAMLGIIAGDMVLISLSGMGFAAVVAQWPLLLQLLRVGGALYIAYLAIGLLRAPPPPTDGALGTAATHNGGFGPALLLTLTNPKPLLFFAAFFPTFIAPSAASTLYSFYLLGAWFEAINVLYFSALIALVARLRHTRALGPTAGARLQTLSGLGLLLCSACVLLA